MKKVITFAIVAWMALGFRVPQAVAATASTPNIAASASVSGALTLDVVLKKNGFNGDVITSMDFGTLKELSVTNPTTGAVSKTLRSSASGSTGTGAVAAFITANSHGLPYAITSTGSALTNGSGATIPTGACTVVPVYAKEDNGNLDKPSGAELGTPGSWVGTRTLYTSERGTAAIRSIQAYYSITDDLVAGATAAVPISQPGGSYGNSNIVITVTA